MKWIQVDVLPAKKMRNRTGADYREDRGQIIIDVVDTGNWKYNALLAIHGLVEYLLVKAFDIPIKAIEEFDRQFEEERARGIHNIHDEPGDSLTAPNSVAHSLATGVERIVAVMFRVVWAEYAHSVDNQCLPRITKHQNAGRRR